MKVVCRSILLAFAVACSVFSFVVYGRTAEKVVVATIAFNLIEGEGAVIRVSQKEGDFSLIVYESQSDQEIEQIETGYLDGLEELAFISSKDCRSCRIDVYPKSIVHSYGEPAIAISEVDPTIAKALEVVFHFYEKAHESIKNSEFDLAEQLLTKARDTALDLDEQQLAIHFDYWLAEANELKGNLNSNWISVAKKARNFPYYQAMALINYGWIEDKLDERQKHVSRAQEIANTHDLTRAKARVALHLGLISSERDSLAEGAVYFDLAQDLYSSVGNYFEENLVLTNYSWLALEQGKTTEAMGLLTELLIKVTELEDHTNRAWTQYYLGRAHGQAGDRASADFELDQALSLLKTIDYGATAEGQLLGALIHREKGSLLLQHGEPKQAIDHVIMSNALLPKLNSYERAANLGLRGRAIAALGDLKTATKLYNAAKNHYIEKNLTKHAGIVSLEVIKLQLKEGDYLKALATYVNTMNLFANSDYLKGKAQAMSLGSEVYQALQDFDSAQTLINDAFLYEKLLTAYERAELYLRRAGLRARRLELQDSLKDLHIARRLVEEVLDNVRRPDLRRSYLALHRNIFEALIDLTQQTDRFGATSSLILANSYNARTLRNQRRTFVSTTPGGERKSLLAALNLQVKQYYGSNASEKTVVQDQVRQARQRLIEFEADHLAFELAPSLKEEGIVALQSRLNEKELILFYFFGEEQGFLWTIEKSAILAHRIERQSEVEQKIAKAISIVSRPPGNRGTSAWESQGVLAAAAEALLKPVYEMLETKKYSRLTIVPDGRVSQIPVSIMSKEIGEEPLIKIAQIGYARSLDIVLTKALLEEGAELPVKKMLVVANPALRSDSSAAQFSTLPGTEYEMNAIQRIANGAKIELSELRNINATKQKLLLAADNGFDVLHFAMHGLMNPDESALSALVLSDRDTADNLLLADEIRSLDLSAQLVVLSACDTYQGPQIAGEGPLGLSRAFLRAGAERTISSLWPVSDVVTASLMEEFYSGLYEEKLPPLAALQKAKLLISERKNQTWSDPYYWGGFILEYGPGHSN